MRKRVEKRGQFTIFIILGMVLIASFAFLLYARVMIAKNTVKARIDQTFTSFIEANSINYYVTNCIEEATKDALLRVGKNGGRIYDFEDGPINTLTFVMGVDYLPFYDNGTLSNVSYGIKWNTTCPFVRNYEPDYPYPNSSINSSVLSPLYSSDCSYYEPFGGFFGLNNLQRLCDVSGPNKIGQSQSGIPELYRTCKLGTYNRPGEISIQEQMNLYINKKVKQCVDFSLIKQVTGLNVTPLNDPNTTVIFGKDGFSVKVTYPFLIIYKNSQPITKFVPFEYRSNIRFKEIYDFVFSLIREDSRDVMFNITEDYYKLSDYRADFLVQKKIDACPNCSDSKFDDIIQVFDNSTASIIKGKPYLFQFAVKNRRPALDYIHKTVPTAPYDIAVEENETIFLEPQGYDPDEGMVYYNYSLWKETYDEWFNFSCCKEYGGVVNCSIDYKKCSVRIDPDSYPHNWTKSSQFQLTNQSAAYITNRSDTGFHVVSISIWDQQWLVDYQIVRILVFDKPIANLTGTNIYWLDPSNRNILWDWNIASLEDEYLLNGSNSKKAVIGNGDIDNYIWADESEPFLYNMTEDHLWIPIDKKYNIENITIVNNFTKTIPSPHKISLTVKTTDGVYSVPNYLDVDVKQCIPYTSQPYYPPYPYNNFTGDDLLYSNIENPFLANHSCCNATNYEYLSADSICYNYTSYGGRMSFNDTLFYNTPLPPNPYPAILYDYSSSLLPPNDRSDNDIYRREFTRYCSGNRGNICNGTAYEIRTAIPCRDDNYGTGGTERCEGPAQNYFSDNSETPFSSSTCYKYPPGKSFENLYGTGTGVCNLNPRCSNLNLGTNNYDADGYGQNGDYLCSATCYDGKCIATIPAFCQDCQGNSAAWDEDNTAGNGYNLDLIGSCHPGKIGSCDSSSSPNKCIMTEPSPINEECDFSDSDNKVFLEYVADNTNCKEYRVNLDDSPFLCNHCMEQYNSNNVNYWNIGNNPQCCGDDANENRIVTTRYGSQYVNWEACCSRMLDCVFGGSCYPLNDELQIGSSRYKCGTYNNWVLV